MGAGREVEGPQVASRMEPVAPQPSGACCQGWLPGRGMGASGHCKMVAPLVAPPTGCPPGPCLKQSCPRVARGQGSRKEGAPPTERQSNLDLSIISRTSLQGARTSGGVHARLAECLFPPGFLAGVCCGGHCWCLFCLCKSSNSAACEDGCRCFGRRSRWEDKAAAQKSRAQGCRHL